MQILASDHSKIMGHTHRENVDSQIPEQEGQLRDNWMFSYFGSWLYTTLSTTHKSRLVTNNHDVSGKSLVLCFWALWTCSCYILGKCVVIPEQKITPKLGNKDKEYTSHQGALYVVLYCHWCNTWKAHLVMRHLGSLGDVDCRHSPLASHLFYQISSHVSTNRKCTRTYAKCPEV